MDKTAKKYNDTAKIKRLNKKNPQVVDFYIQQRLQPEAPFAVRFVNIYEKQFDSFHCHADFNELVIVLYGSSRHEFGDRTIFMKSGEVLFLKRGSIHRYAAIRNFTHYNILFPDSQLDPLRKDLREIPGFRLIFEPTGQESAVLYLKEENMLEVISILENLRKELKEQKTGWKNVIESEFIRMIVTLSRSVSITEPEKGPREYSFQMDKVLHYMESECLRKNTGIPELAAIAGMSESNFRHRFVEIVGFSPLDYLIRLRLKHSLHLLLLGSTISAAAHDSGFLDEGYFSRQFSKYIGMAPGKFRKKISAGTTSFDTLCELLFRTR